MSEQSAFLSRALTGICLQDPTRLPDLLRSVNANDFDPPYNHTISTMARLSLDGPLDPWVLQHAVAAVYPGLPNDFIAATSTVGLPISFDLYVAQFREGLARRRLSEAAVSVEQAARMDDLRMGFERVRGALEDAEAVLQPQTLPLLDGQLVWDYEAPAESVLLPGLMWRQSRAVITGFEGSGKSILLRQMVIAGALGIHPFKTHGRIEPIRTLMLDLENPPAIAQSAMRSMLDTLATRGDVDRGADLSKFKYAIRSDGLDIVGRGRDREFVTRAVATHRPDLLCIGPIYRLAAAGGNLDEQTAGSVLDYLNQLRTTYDVAIITEAHAAKGATDERDPNQKRGLTPSGSGVWMRFPEVGRGLRYNKEASDTLHKSIYRLEEWRGDRSLHMTFPKYVARATHGQIWYDDVSEEVEAQC